MHNDLYGSVESITDEKGALLPKYTYTPFGLLNCVLLEYKCGREFERLVIFKGRVYDCVYVARFISSYKSLTTFKTRIDTAKT